MKDDLRQGHRIVSSDIHYCIGRISKHSEFNDGDTSLHEIEFLRSPREDFEDAVSPVIRDQMQSFDENSTSYNSGLSRNEPKIVLPFVSKSTNLQHSKSSLTSLTKSVTTHIPAASAAKGPLVSSSCVERHAVSTDVSWSEDQNHVCSVNIPHHPSCPEGKRLGDIRRKTTKLNQAYEKQRLLKRKLKDSITCPSAEELRKLQMSYNETQNLQQEISEEMEAGRLNVERRMVEEQRIVEDYCYERYGFVFVEATDTLDAFSTLSEPLTDPHPNSASSLSPSGSLGPDEIEKELTKLRRRLDNLGKSPKAQTNLKDLTAPRRQRKRENSFVTKNCSIS